jgi:hypothetical protein
MGKAKRCRTVVIGASVAALGATGACPAQAATATPATPRGAHVAPRHKHHAKPTNHASPAHGPYVYEASVEAEMSTHGANMRCDGGTLKLVGVGLSAEGPDQSYTRTPEIALNSNDLWDQNPAAWEGPHTITAGPATTLTMHWMPPSERQAAEAESARNNGEIRNPRLQGQEDTALATAVCAATSPNAGVASIGRGLATWRLPHPVTSVRALLSEPVTSIFVNEYITSGIEILPNGNLASFIRHVRRSETSRLVLATREYVLQKAKIEIEELQWQRLEADKYALTLARYSRLDRARIFYNHVYFSPEVDEIAIADLLAERAYLQVIEHPAYSPRLIEWMTGLGGHVLSARERARYSRFCMSVLEDPESLWRHAYGLGLGDAERCLLLALPGLPANVPIADLEAAYAVAAARRAINPSRSAFEAALKVLQDSFVRVIDWGQGRLYVSAMNPSLIDFLKTQLAAAPGEFALALAGSAYFEQVTFLHGIADEAALPESEWAKDLATAVGRTLERDAPGADPLQDGSRRREPEHFSERLERVVGWCPPAPRLAEHLAPFIATLLSSKQREIADGEIHTLVYWPRLLVALNSAGFDVAEQLASMSRRVLDRGDTLVGFEAFRELQSAQPALYTLGEAAATTDRFASWAAACLDEATGYFDDMEEFERFEDLAQAFGVELAEEAVDIAREDIHEVQAEREAEAAREVDQDEEDYRTGGGHSSDRDWEQIDSMFGMLGPA